MPKTVLALVPHPDDAEFYAGGTIAKMAADGCRVFIAVATDGSKGSFELTGRELTDARAAEMAAACSILGAESPIMLGFTDFELDLLPPGKLREVFIRLIREHKPDVVITEDPFWLGEPHPDHRVVALAAMEAINYASLPRLHPEHLDEGLQSHFVPEKYYYSEEPSRFNKYVDISATFEKKVEAMAAHASQVEFLVEGVLRQARIAGLDLQAIFGELADDKLSLLRMGLKMTTVGLAASQEFELAEAFHYQRFDPIIENFLAGS
ncbi:MAG: PIG-L family deacetylase [Anaerolineaceae bacterium]|nr:PIG-L family deacetylase [Anaerolineaceae bacterium]